CQIKVVYKGGREELITSGPGWKTSTGPILASEIYQGETYDARLEKPGWTNADFDDSTWSGVRVVSHPKNDLVSAEGPPVRRIEEIRPIKITKTPAGDTVADMGQNMVGWVRLKVQGPSGTTVTLRHAEVLDHQGNFYTENLRAAKQTVSYTLKGGGVEVFEPHFTFQGFRYVLVSGYPTASKTQLAESKAQLVESKARPGESKTTPAVSQGELSADGLTGIVIHSDMSRSGDFETSNKLVNQLQHNIIWGQKGNFVDVPTDCPQRDERLGWTGDAQVFSRTAAF